MCTYTGFLQGEHINCTMWKALILGWSSWTRWVLLFPWHETDHWGQPSFLRIVHISCKVHKGTSNTLWNLKLPSYSLVLKSLLNYLVLIAIRETYLWTSPPQLFGKIIQVLQGFFITYQEFILHPNLCMSDGSVGNVYPPLSLDDHDWTTHGKSPERLKSQTLVRNYALWERNLFRCNILLKMDTCGLSV